MEKWTIDHSETTWEINSDYSVNVYGHLEIDQKDHILPFKFREARTDRFQVIMCDLIKNPEFYPDVIYGTDRKSGLEIYYEDGMKRWKYITL